MQDHIYVKGARENNLKNVDVTIPRDKLVVSKAREDLPLPDRPVSTTSLSLGMDTSIFFRLFTRAPLTVI